MLYGCDRMGCTVMGWPVPVATGAVYGVYPFNHFFGGRPDSEYDEARCENEG